MIKLHVSFNNTDGESPDWKSMGIDPPDSEGAFWRELYFNPDNIISTGSDNDGKTNLLTVDSEVWVVRESPKEVAQKISNLKYD